MKHLSYVIAKKKTEKNGTRDSIDKSRTWPRFLFLWSILNPQLFKKLIFHDLHWLKAKEKYTNEMIKKKLRC